MLITYSCDVEYPEKWEAPNWQLPLTIPLIDQIYNVSDISSDDNQIRIDSSSQTFIIRVDTTLLDSGVIKIEESFFIVPATSPVQNEVSFAIPSDGIVIPDLSIDPISLTSLIGSGLGDCLPYAILEDYDNTISLDAISITEGLDLDYIESIDSVRVAAGEISLEVTNDFPFDIAAFSVPFSEEINGSNIVWESPSVTNILSGSTESATTNLVPDPSEPRRLPSAIIPGTSIQVNDDGSDNPGGECKYYIPDNNPISEVPIDGVDQIACVALGYTWVVDQCIAPMTLGLCTQATLDTALGDDFDTGVDGVEGDDILVSWESGPDGGASECWLYLPGWDLTSQSNELSIDVSFDNIIMRDIFGHIVYESDTTITQSISLDESISLISAHIANIANEDTNKIKLDVTNDLFTPVNIELSIENILDDFGQPFSYQAQVANGINFVDAIDLSDNDIRGPDIGPFENLIISNKISFDSENTQIIFDQDYSLNINSIFTTPIQFDELYVDLQDFSTPDIDMASVPAGFGDIGLPTLRFNLYMYNEINAPLRLNLDFMGITEDDTVKIHVEPALKFPEGYDGIDTTTISIYSDTLEVIGLNFTDYYQLEAPIDTLFSRDEIKVTGNATLNGESSLKPGKSFWGDVGIELRPLTIVFPEDVTFSPQAQTELALDEGTRSNIDEGLVSAELFIEVGNSMPLGATLNMLASDSTFFPLCFDTLKTGTELNQTVSDTCWTLIEQNYSPDSIYVNAYEDGEVISAEFLNADTTTCFIGRLISLDLGVPTNLDENGFILEKSIAYNNILLDTTKMNWLTSNDKLYISPIINDVRTSIDSLPGYVTFHTIDYLQIRSFLTLIMDSKIVTGDGDED